MTAELPDELFERYGHHNIYIADNYVEENAGISEEETVAAKGPTASEEDEWLYSQPRRFAKKPAHGQKD